MTLKKKNISLETKASIKYAGLTSVKALNLFSFSVKLAPVNPTRLFTCDGVCVCMCVRQDFFDGKSGLTVKSVPLESIKDAQLSQNNKQGKKNSLYSLGKMVAMLFREFEVCLGTTCSSVVNENKSELHTLITRCHYWCETLTLYRVKSCEIN